MLVLHKTNEILWTDRPAAGTEIRKNSDLKNYLLATEKGPKFLILQITRFFFFLR